MKTGLMPRRLLRAGALIFAVSLGGAAQAATLIHAGRVIDGVSDAVKTNQTVVVDAGKITAIEAGFRQPAAGDRVIDLRNGTLLPGLFDMHVHITSEYNRQREIDNYKLNESDVTINGVVYAQRTLLAGFTTVRDLGDEYRASIALRNAINAGKVPGPRIVAAGKAIATTGGHADPTNGWARKFPANPGPAEGVVNSVEDARKAVRQRYKDGSDTIKITATGGVLSIAKSGSNPQFTEEEIRAVVATARDYGFKVAAHAHGAEGIKRAVRGGVDTIEHGTFLDDEGIKLMKEHGTFLVPTISAGRWVYDQAQDPTFFPAVVRPKALEVGAADPENLRQGVQVRREDPVRHRHRRQQPRRERARVQADGGSGHAAHGSHPGRHQCAREVPRARRPGSAASPSASWVSWSECPAIRSRTSPSWSASCS